ncbi:MAG TPA: ABC transporter permease [Bacillales bacterium]|nr:ABC transporter permease [Bacillales bacterium]
MVKYIAKRILISLPVLFGISLVAFFVVRLVPGDTVTAMLGTNYSEHEADLIRHRYGLDKPIYVQYGIWLLNLLHGDFGVSSFTHRPVLQLIFERLPITLELTILSVSFAVLFAIPFGTYAAILRNSPVDYGTGFFGLLGLSIPNFWLGTMLVLYFSLYLGWLPSSGFVGFLEDPLGNAKSMLLPTLTLGTAVGAVIMRMTRSSMLEITREEYIKVARAKGVKRARLIWKHAIKNAMIPVITIIGVQVGYLMGGSVVIEQIFALPGIGRLALHAITNRDYPLLQGTILFIATFFVVINLLVDIIYAFLNPKIRY